MAPQVPRRPTHGVPSSAWALGWHAPPARFCLAMSSHISEINTPHVCIFLSVQSISVSKLAHLAEMDEATLRAQLALMRKVSQVVTWTRGDCLQVRAPGALLRHSQGVQPCKGGNASAAAGLHWQPSLQPGRASSSAARPYR